MDRHTLLEILAAAGFWLPFYVAIFLAIFAHRHPPRENYLKRVARKYSISPLNLR